ncbi:MAG TPA: sulfatase-like hydrolase/transferase, partial [Isosphaeraceae bacterium]|nr:sulfatase-like hydrolase/transferase [Isosphaeraceae bacterium]
MPATSRSNQLRNSLVRRFPQALGTASPTDAPTSTRTPLLVAAEILASALWLGAATGFAEVAILCLWHMIQGEAVLGALQLNRHFPWMIPLAYLGIYACSAIPIMVLALFWPKPAVRMGVAVPLFLTTFALLSLCKGLYPVAKVVLSTALAYRLSHRIVGHETAFRRIRTLSLAPVFGSLVGLGYWSYDQEVLQEGRILQGLPDPKPGAKNVLLIVLDTVAADHLSLYGYERDTTPKLRALARSGVVFDMARSPAPWTLPAHASIFTARWPHELNVGAHKPLDGTYPTLAEYLAHHGYATSGFIGNTYYCNSWFGLARGFQHYEDYYEENVLVSPSEALRCSTLGRALIHQFGAAYNVRPEVTNTPKDARRINHDFLQWLDQHNDRPFFTFLNYLDAHDPYLTPPGSNRHFGRVPSTEEEIRTLHHWSKFIHEHAAHIDQPPPADQMELVHDAYDDCLFALDEQIGHLMDELRS